MAVTVKQKIQQSISECSRSLADNFKKYNALVEEGSQHVTMLVAHKTCSDSVAYANIDDTDTYESKPDLKLKLACTLKKEMNDVEEAIQVKLKELDEIFSAIIKQCDKVFSVYRIGLESNLSLEEFTEGSEDSFSITQRVEAFDLFKRKFNNNHYARKYSLSYFNLGGDVNNLLKLWTTSGLRNIQQACYAVF